MPMAKESISEGLREFLKQKIQTVLRLEVLLLLHGHRPRTFTATEIASRLGFESDTTAHELEQLQAIGVVVHSSSDETKYKYHPQNEKLEFLVEQLALHYSKHRVPILSVMLAERPDRTRLFTEAFKIIRRND